MEKWVFLAARTILNDVCVGLEDHFYDWIETPGYKSDRQEDNGQRKSGAETYFAKAHFLFH